MKILDHHRAHRDARLRGAEAGPNRYGEAVNRYLGAVGYRSGAAVPADQNPPAPVLAKGTVVVGVDETPGSYTAVDQAAIEAELRGWDLLLLHAQWPGALRSPNHDSGARLLERLSARVHACSPAVPVIDRLVIGYPLPTLLAEARDANLLVVGHRHTAAGSAFGLSVGDRLAACHPDPVLIVRVPGWPPGPGFADLPVVVGVNRPGATTPAVRFALEEARVRGCDLVMVHAAPGTEFPGRAETVNGVLVHHRTVDAEPVDALIDFSGRAAAVVVGRHGAGESAVPVLGLVGRALVQRANCPVFLTS